MSGVVTGSMPVLVAVDRATDDARVVPAQRGLGPGAALRRRRPRRGRAAALDAPRARPQPRPRARPHRSARPARAAAPRPARRRRAAPPHAPRDAARAPRARPPTCRRASPPSSSATTSSRSTSPWSPRRRRWRRRPAYPARRSSTVIARNGVEVGVKLSGTGERVVHRPGRRARIRRGSSRGYAPADMQRDLGDSAIVEVVRARRAGRRGVARVRAVGRPRPRGGAGDPGPPAPHRGRRPSRASAGGRSPAILGVDARAVVRERIVPPIHTGIAASRARSRPDRRRRHASADRGVRRRRGGARGGAGGRGLARVATPTASTPSCATGCCAARSRSARS